MNKLVFVAVIVLMLAGCSKNDMPQVETATESLLEQTVAIKPEQPTEQVDELSGELEIERLDEYVFKGVRIGDSKEMGLSAFGEPIKVNTEGGEGSYSRIDFQGVSLFLKNDTIIAMDIKEGYMTPEEVKIGYTLFQTMKEIGSGNLVQEQGNPLTVYEFVTERIAIGFAFEYEEDEVLYNDSKIQSIMIADAKLLLEGQGIDFEVFKKMLIPVTFTERPSLQGESETKITYSSEFYGRWTPVNAEEGGSVYIELDDMGRGVLEFNNEGEILSYMIHSVKESEQETVVEYDDETGTTHEVTMSIQNSVLHLTIDSGFIGMYEKIAQ